MRNNGFFNYRPRSDGSFDRSLLPDPQTYYDERAGLRLLGRGAWRSALCPFHDERHPSFRVNVDTGAYRCFGCGARGGDVLAFHRARYGLSFVQAARDLGASGWNEFRHAVLPQIMPGLAAGIVHVFAPATGQFVIPDLLGGSKTVLLGNVIQQQFGASRDWPFGSALATIAMLIVLAVLWLNARVAQQKKGTL